MVTSELLCSLIGWPFSYSVGKKTVFGQISAGIGPDGYAFVRICWCL